MERESRRGEGVVCYASVGFNGAWTLRACTCFAPHSHTFTPRRVAHSRPLSAIKRGVVHHSDPM